MLLDMHRIYWNRIKSIADQIPDPAQRKIFYKDERSRFRDTNTGPSAKLVLKKFKDEIRNCDVLISQAVANSSVKGETTVEETIPEKIRRILAPLREVGSKGSPIITEGDIETLIEAYMNYQKDPDWRPSHFIGIRIHGRNDEFYPSLKRLHRELGLKVEGVGQMLNFLLLVNNVKADDGGALAPGTAEKNIKNSKV